MKFCPKNFAQDMSDPQNLKYCQSIQEKDRCKGCAFYAPTNEDSEKRTKKKEPPTTKQERLF